MQELIPAEQLVEQAIEAGRRAALSTVDEAQLDVQRLITTRTGVA